LKKSFEKNVLNIFSPFLSIALCPRGIAMPNNKMKVCVRVRVCDREREREEKSGKEYKNCEMEKMLKATMLK